jgi:mono/diheme cytochrome c family protein
MRAHLRWLSELAAWFALIPQATGALPEPAPRAVEFARDIEPIFARHCIGCHGPEKQKSDYRLDDRARALKGGESEEAAILPGRSAESPLIQFVAGLDADVVMPPKNSDKPRLTPEQISLLRAWIDQGAVWPEDASKTRAQHWSFKPITRPNPPQATGPVVNSIDRFILARLAPAGLGLSREADRRTLIRRVSFDLIGLPPTPEEVTAFTSDPAPGAYEKLVNRLLDSPRYGERWARHWLDVVRFAESDGFETNQPRSNAWRYRDYVIRAFNDDKPYDQFIREQLAGDAFGADEATGFLVAGPFDRVKSPDPTLTANQRADELQDMVSAVGSTFLGLTVNCARCHNHKFDPISQVDYYSMVACVSGVQHGDRQLRGTDDEGRRRKAEALRLQPRGNHNGARRIGPDRAARRD